MAIFKKPNCIFPGSYRIIFSIRFKPHNTTYNRLKAFLVLRYQKKLYALMPDNQLVTRPKK
jgi:hypothetical protein